MIHNVIKRIWRFAEAKIGKFSQILKVSWAFLQLWSSVARYCGFSDLRLFQAKRGAIRRWGYGHPNGVVWNGGLIWLRIGTGYGYAAVDNSFLCLPQKLSNLSTSLGREGREELDLTQLRLAKWFGDPTKLCSFFVWDFYSRKPV